ncbi:hypothetical protein AB0E63_21830 [Kribbella sp. NPDC026596]|uniref:hypothetical protein n=1 Tax=Kribbella sp. NPDC026596 TaxID=3155122 RepID=UPI0034008ECC
MLVAVLGCEVHCDSRTRDHDDRSPARVAVEKVSERACGTLVIDVLAAGHDLKRTEMGRQKSAIPASHLCDDVGWAAAAGRP